jgi:Protein of unknown function (DUF3226)
MDKPECRKQLLVEGEVDYFFILFMFETLNLEKKDVEIRCYQGKDKLEDYLESFLYTFEDEVDIIGILRDADSNGQAAFDSVRGIIQRCNRGFPVPDNVNQFEGNDKKSGIMILPSIDAKGYLETLILQATMGGDCISECVNDFAKRVYLCRETLPLGKNVGVISYDEAPYIDKVKFYSYLATQDVSGGLIKTAARMGCLKYESQVYNPLKEFISNLAKI